MAQYNVGQNYYHFAREHEMIAISNVYSVNCHVFINIQIDHLLLLYNTQAWDKIWK